MRKIASLLVLCFGIAVLAVVLLFGGVASADSMTKTIDITYRNIKLVLDGREIVPKDVNDNIVEPFIYNGTTWTNSSTISR